jgi:hypothetical protein
MIVKVYQFGDWENFHTLIQAVHLNKTYGSIETHREIRIMHCSNIKNTRISELVHMINC